jgi:CTP synthase (UTP-ammonia lyase)
VAAATIAVVGEYQAASVPLAATQRTLESAGVAFEWLPTERAAQLSDVELACYAAFWIAPGSPYASIDGALRAIRVAREQGIPLFGNCGGFQYLVVEFVRGILGEEDADHAETRPDGERLAITPLACSLAGTDQEIQLLPDTQVAGLYGAERALEPFFCTYGLSPAYRPRIEAAGLTVAAVDADNEVRALELRDHPFFVGTLYVPQTRSEAPAEHPLVAAFLASATRGAAGASA